MNKHLGAFFSSLFAIALGVGLSSSSLYVQEPKRWEEVKPLPDLVFVDGVLTLGRYPQTISDVDPNKIKDEGTYDYSSGLYRYNEKLYAIETVKIDNDFISSAKWNNGALASSSNNVEKAFLVEDLKWEILSTGEGYADIISTRIIEREAFNGSGNGLEYLSSDLFISNRFFFDAAFDTGEEAYIISFDSNNPDYVVDLPDASVLKDYADDKAEYPSDYAIAKNLSGNYSGTGQSYVNGPFWTKTKSSQGDRIIVQWTKQGSTNCLVNDPKIGVRPVLRVLYNGPKGGGGGTGISIADTSSPKQGRSGGGGGNVTLVLGIVFMVIGAGGLVAFFVYWSKKHKDGKPPIWLIASIGCCLIISVVGIGCFSGGVSGGNTVVGWYQGNNYDCVGFGERLAINLTADGKVYRYVGDAWVDSATNYLLVLQSGVGEWEYSNGKLTIYASAEWNLSSWEGLEVTYNDCNGLGSFLHYEGYVGSAYQWYHYSRVDSGGTASIRVADTHESGNINFGLRGF